MLSTNKLRSKIRKGIAIFSLINILNQLLFPTIALALTSGPTAPEASSFEPIDTTDMVNPLTGDFTYNLPLLEIPGPEGGYPLSLSYHAGIQPNEEASWAGLGWGISTGSISRNVNGYPDDFSGQTNAVRSYWGGGSTKSLGVNVSFYLAPVSVSFGLDFSQDTYRGFGIGASMGVGFGLWQGSGLQGGVTLGVSPYGDPYVGANIGISNASGGAGFVAGAGLSVTTNFESINVGATASVSYTDGRSKGKGVNASLLGTSISSSGGKASFTLGGGSTSVNNANAGKIRSESSGWAFAIPLPIISIGVSHNYRRYWSNEMTEVGTYGVLYSTSSSSGYSALDTYRLLDPINENVVDSPDPDQLVGGTYPNYDDYSVTAQGLSGSIRPYNFQNTLFTQDQINNEDHSNDITTNYISSNRSSGNKLQYRFINDFSNRYTQDPSNFTEDFVYGAPVYGNDDGTYGYNPSNNRLSGSKHIEWFTNNEIHSGILKTQNFIRPRSKGFERRTDLPNQIGGFMITNSSGVTYHYALPVYSFNEYTESRKIEGVSTYNSLSKPTAYAYTWYLTAITGPDYVDRNENKEVDEDDWGYWVEFNYGKWNKDYRWRNPSQGFHNDIDNTFKSYSSGIKEVYYLDFVRTRSHTALFVKELRNDSKSSFSYNGECSALKLDHILLMQNSDLITSIDDIRKSSLKLNFPYLPASSIRNEGTNVIDLDDFSSIGEEIIGKCIRKIQFNYDYSLSMGTPNSYEDSFHTSENTSIRTGKLTLLSVDFQGKGGASMTPPIEFEYDLDVNDPINQENIRVVSSSISSRRGHIEVESGDKLSPGDIIKFTANGSIYYCTLTEDEGNKRFEVLYLDDKPFNTPSFVPAVKTKNPPYNKDFYDIWHLYKSDYRGSGSDNISRITTDISNKATDVWTLRRIKASTGSEMNIDYEGDTYSQSVLNKNRSLAVDNFSYLGGTASSGHQARVNISGNEQPLNKIFKVGDKIDIIALAKFDFTNPPPATFADEYNVIESSKYLQPAKVIEISGNQIVFSLGDEMKRAFTETRTKSFRGTSSDATANIIAGNLKVSGVSRFYGGGIRVASITVDNLNGVKKQTRYNYSRPGLSTNDDGGSSGVTSYEPISLEVTSPTLDDAANKAYKRALYKDMDYLLSIGREVPVPGVMYEYVSVEEFDILPEASGPIKRNGKTQYQYEVFNRNMLGIKQYKYEKAAGRERKNMSIKDYTSRIGNLKRIITYDDKGNKLTEQVNHYLHDAMADKSFDYQVSHYGNLLMPYNYQGTIQERYSDARTVKVNNIPADKRVMSGRDTYPAIQTGATVFDYKNGIRVESRNLSYDFYSGVVTKTLSSDSYGNRFISEVIPAYRKYPALGLKTGDDASGSVFHRHMLIQEASNLTYAVNGFDVPIGIVSANVRTWSNDIATLDHDGDLTTYKQNNIWRQKAIYAWLPAGVSQNGLTPISSFIDFFSDGQSNPNWKKTSEVTKYNVYSAALEGTDINGSYSATRMGYNNGKVTMTANSSRYHEIAYTGVEDGIPTVEKSGSVSYGEGVIVSETAHTGERSLKVAGGKNGFKYLISLNQLDPVRRDYTVAVWVKPTLNNVFDARLYYSVDGSEIEVNPVFNKTAAGWFLLEMKIPASALNGNNLVVGCKNMGAEDLNFDDFRFQPLNAVAVAYVYDNKSGELTYIINNNNLYTHYEYDKAGRLIKTYKELLGKPQIPIVKETIINYSKGAKWVNTGNTRCQSIMEIGEIYYTGLIEAEQKDRSLVSVTFNQTKWVVIPGKATCTSATTVEAWVATGKKRCELDINHMGYTGFYEEQQKDVNVSSPTYNQTRWRRLEMDYPSECPKTVFIKWVPDYDAYPYASYYIEIYSDPEFLSPITLERPLTVSYTVNVTHFVGGQITYEHKSLSNVTIPEGHHGPYLLNTLLHAESSGATQVRTETVMASGRGYL